MRAPAYKALKRVYRCREMTVPESLALFPRVHNDHRDFYVAASLIKGGYVGRVTSSYETGQEKRSWTEQSEMDLAINLQFQTMGTGEITYRLPHSGHPLRMHGVGGVDDPFYCTAKTDLYFRQLKERRGDRWFAILIALLAAFATAVFARAIETWLL